MLAAPRSFAGVNGKDDDVRAGWGERSQGAGPEENWEKIRQTVMPIKAAAQVKAVMSQLFKGLASCGALLHKL